MSDNEANRFRTFLWTIGAMVFASLIISGFTLVKAGIIDHEKVRNIEIQQAKFAHREDVVYFENKLTQLINSNREILELLYNNNREDIQHLLEENRIIRKDITSIGRELGITTRSGK